MSESATRGRPPIADADKIAAIAVDLFATRGYDSVSMAEVALTAGISRRALFNYFPSKAALVWGGFEPFTTAVNVELESSDNADPLLATVEHALLAAFAALPVAPSTLRFRLQIIHNHPDLFAYGAHSLSGMQIALERYANSRLGHAAASVDGIAIAQALTLVSFTAFQRWAMFSSDESPATILHDMFDALRTGLTD